MLRRVKHLKDSIFYTIAEVVNHSSGIFALPIILRQVSIEVYGQITFLVIFLTLFRYLIGLSVKSSYFRLLYNNSASENKSLTTVTVVNITILFIFFFSAFFILDKNFGSTLIEGVENSNLILCLTVAYFYALFELCQSLLRFKEKAKSYALVNILRVILEISSLIILFRYFEDGIKVKFSATLISLGLCVFILFKTTVIPNLTKSYSISISKKLIRFSIPLILNGIVGWLMVSFDQYLIKSYFGFDELALLGVALQLIAAYKYGFEGVLKGVYNLVFKKSEKIGKYSIDIFTFFLNLFLLGAIALTFLGEPIIQLIGKHSYTKSIDILLYLIPGRIILLLNTVLVIFSISQMKAKLVLKSTILSTLILMIMSWWLIPIYGMVAVGISSFFAGLSRFILINRTLSTSIPIFRNSQIFSIVLFIIILISFYFKIDLLIVFILTIGFVFISSKSIFSIFKNNFI